MRVQNFLAKIDPQNRIWDILKIEKDKNRLQILIASRQEVSAVKSMLFQRAASFTHALSGGPGDSEQLPQSLIGVDYWLETDESEMYRWEINGDECTWNFSAQIPTVTDLE
jgi:hypothetical protein